MNAERLKRFLHRRSLSGLMSLYESNYRLLTKLIPDLASIHHPLISSLPGAPDLHLEVEERGRFTTTVHLSYFFVNESGERRAEPDLLVRLYHDARQAEAMLCRIRRVRSGQPAVSALRCKWDANLFLEKWLVYALSQGYCFTPAVCTASRSRHQSPEVAEAE